MLLSPSSFQYNALEGDCPICSSRNSLLVFRGLPRVRTWYWCRTCNKAGSAAGPSSFVDVAKKIHAGLVNELPRAKDWTCLNMLGLSSSPSDILTAPFIGYLGFGSQHLVSRGMRNRSQGFGSKVHTRVVGDPKDACFTLPVSLAPGCLVGFLFIHPETAHIGYALYTARPESFVYFCHNPYVPCRFTHSLFAGVSLVKRTHGMGQPMPVAASLRPVEHA